MIFPTSDLDLSSIRLNVRNDVVVTAAERRLANTYVAKMQEVDEEEDVPLARRRSKSGRKRKGEGTEGKKAKKSKIDSLALAYAPPDDGPPRPTPDPERLIDAVPLRERDGISRRFTVKDEGLAPALAIVTRVRLSFAAEGYAPRRCRPTVPERSVGASFNIESTR